MDTFLFFLDSSFSPPPSPFSSSHSLTHSLTIIIHSYTVANFFFSLLKRIFWWKQKQHFRFLLANKWSILACHSFSLDIAYTYLLTSTILDDIFYLSYFFFPLSLSLTTLIRLGVSQKQMKSVTRHLGNEHNLIFFLSL